jgi:hypothetical protein
MKRCALSPIIHWFWVPTALCLTSIPGLGVTEQKKLPTQKEYVKVEVRGELGFSVTPLYDQAKTGTSLTPDEMHAYVTANGITWQLDFHKHQDKLGTAFRKLLAKSVIVTGTLGASDLARSGQRPQLPLVVSHIRAAEASDR